MRKREFNILEKKEYISKFLAENKLNYSFKEYISFIKGHYYKDIIYTENIIEINGFYYRGLVDIKSPNPRASKQLTDVYFKCEDCKNLSKNNKSIKEKNPDTGKLLCQKCSCKYTNLRESKRNKNSSTIKKRYDSGELDYMKEISKKMLIERNKTTQRNYILNLSNSEKKRIAIQKRKTFYKKNKKQRDEINKRRTIKFKQFNDLKHELRKKYLSTLSKKDLAKAREYSYTTGDNWKKIRRQIIIECNNICSNCGIKIKKNIDIHHTIPFSLKPQNVDLIPLCRKCHINIEWSFRRKYLETNDIFISRDYSLKNLKNKKLYMEQNNGNN